MHALEIGSAGQVAFATRAEPAWHMLGTVFAEDEHVTTTEMLRKAHLSGWNIRLVDAPDVVDGQQINAAVPLFYVLRDNPFEAGQVDRLAAVGARYNVVQNEELFSFGDALLDGGGQWETAGSIAHGTKVFGSLRLDREMILDPQGANDHIDSYLLVTTSHDGSLAVMAATTPVRVVCQNTLNMALGGVKQAFKMRHTTTIDGRIAQARKAIGLSFAYLDVFEAEAQTLIQTEMTNAEFSKIVTGLYPKPENESKAALTRWENKIDLIGDIFNGAVENAPNTSENIAGTAWAGLNALTERLDWYRKPRKGEIESVAVAASGLDPVVNAEKARIKSAIQAFVKDKVAA